VIIPSERPGYEADDRGCFARPSLLGPLEHQEVRRRLEGESETLLALQPVLPARVK
jgi:hypothetical protein